MSTKCPQCGTENQDNAKFCNECGYRFPQQNVCPSCGLPVQPGIKFCSNCGHSFVAKTAPQPVHAAAPRQQSSAPQAAPVTPHQPTPAAPTQQQPPTPQSASTVHAQPQSPVSQPTREAHTQQQPPVPHPTPETVTPSSPAPQEQPTAPKPVSPRSHKRIFGRMGKKEENSKPAADGTTEFVDPDQFFNQQSPVRNTPTPPPLLKNSRNLFRLSQRYRNSRSLISSQRLSLSLCSDRSRRLLSRLICRRSKFRLRESRCRRSIHSSLLPRRQDRSSNMHSQDFRPSRRRFSSLYRQTQIRVCRTHSSLPVSLMLWDKGPGSNSRLWDRRRIRKAISMSSRCPLSSRSSSRNSSHPPCRNSSLSPGRMSV